VTTSAAAIDPFALVSPDVGVVHRLDEGMAAYDHPRLASAFAQLCDLGSLFDSALAARAGGMAPGRQDARRAALGEAVERYSAAYVPRSRLRTARAAELDRPCVEPEWLDSRADHPPVRWVPADQLFADGSSRAAWAAASRVYLSGPDEQAAIAVPTSTGLACHSDPWQALYAGLLEVIERDAVMTTWLLREPVTPLTGTLRWRLDDRTDVRFDRAVEDYRLVRLPTPVDVPVVLALAFGAAGHPPVAVGAAADPDLARACRRALIEAQQTFAWAARMLADATPAPADAALIDDLDEHVAYYLDPARLSAFDWLRHPTATPVEVDVGTVAPRQGAALRCRELIGRLAAADLECFAVDVTSPDVREAGLWVVRALIPGLYPLLVGTRRGPDHPRIPRDLVPTRDPHPFP
jgi:ribosomal protein S12 methylthiotransferase accessory factor